MATQDVKRKLTTILAANVEGYARLMHADEEASPETEGYSERKNKWRRPRPLVSLSAAMILLQACTAAYIGEEKRASFGRIGLVSASFTPEIEIPEPIAATGRGAFVGAGTGALGGLAVGGLVFAAALSSCVLAPPACPAVAPYVLGGAVAGGAVGAAIGSADEEAVIAARESFGPIIEKQLVQDALRARVMAYATQHGVGPFAVIDDPRPSTPEELIDYRPLGAEGIDTVLEVRLLRLNLRKVAVFVARYKPGIVARARVIRVRDYAILSDETYGLWGEEAEIDSWGGDNGRRFQSWATYAYATLAEYILDEMILAYRPKSAKMFIGVTISSESALSSEESLSGLTGFGLRPINPESGGKCFHCKDVATSEGSYVFPEVDTLRPEFRWEPLARATQSADDKAAEDIRNVKYEIRLFDAEHTDQVWRGIVPKLLDGPIYGRSGLVEPRHRIEQSLTSCAKYFWTVRARFHIDGQPRLTEWANSHGRLWQLRRLAQSGLPSDYYFPFQTHCPANAGTN